MTEFTKADLLNIECDWTDPRGEIARFALALLERAEKDERELVERGKDIHTLTCALESERLRAESAEAGSAWLIEMKDYVHPVPAWWGGSRYGWRHDANEAVRFCRKVDAERVIESMPWKHNAIATQHSWIPPMPRAEEGE